MEYRDPLILALETATACGSVAVTRGGCVVCEHTLSSGTTHSHRLLETVSFVLDQAELTWDDLDLVAVSIGPGSFTGLRIGLATAKGICFASGLPLAGIPTLDGLAAQAGCTALPVRVLVDARKKQVYTAAYSWDKDRGLVRNSGYQALAPEEVAAMIDRPSLVIGDGCAAYSEVFQRGCGALLLEPLVAVVPRAAAIGALGFRRWQAEDLDEPASLVPLYVRPSEAELHFGKKK